MEFHPGITSPLFTSEFEIYYEIRNLNSLIVNQVLQNYYIEKLYAILTQTRISLGALPNEKLKVPCIWIF
jgi:hypothetical protein